MGNHHLYIVGFMGCGKSTVGKILANRLNMLFVDLDHFIEETVGMEIPQIFSEYGEEHFREAESFVLQQVAESPSPAVVATGGGVVLREENREVMKTTGTMVYLHAPAEVLWERASSSGNRPLAKEFQSFLELWQARLPLYREARIEIDSSANSPEEVAEEVLGALGLTQKKEA